MFLKKIIRLFKTFKTNNNNLLYKINDEILKKQILLQDKLAKQMFTINKIPLDKNERIRFHIIYVMDSYWPSIDSLYTACTNDDRFDVKVIYLDLKTNTKINNYSQIENAESYLKENMIPYINATDYDPESERPHILLYQNPYNNTYSKIPKLNARRLTEIGIRIVYIPYGIECISSSKNIYARNIQFEMSVQKMAWRIFSMNREIKNNFHEYCSLGGYHVRAIGHPKFDYYLKTPKKKLPNFIIKKANSRKIIAIQLTFPKRLDKNKKSHNTLHFSIIKDILKSIERYSEIFFVITFHPLLKTRFLTEKLGTGEDWDDFLNHIQARDNMCIYTGDYQLLLANSDALITELSSIMIEMAFLEKPVLYLYNKKPEFLEYAEKIVDTFYTGRSEKDVTCFIDDIILKDNDTKKASRESIRSLFYSRHENKGVIIKNEIYNDIAKGR